MSPCNDGTERAYRFAAPETAEERRMAWEAMQAEGLDRVVMYHRLRPSILDWLDVTDPGKALLIHGYEADKLCCALWINPVSGRSGCIHFCIFRAWRADADRLGRQALDYVFRHWDFACVWGLTPAPYRHALRQFARWGAEVGALRLPEALPMPRRDNPLRCVDAVLSCLTRDQFYGG